MTPGLFCSAAGRLLLAGVASLALGAQAAAQTPSGALRAPNVVEISPQLVTAGQPTAEALAELRARGFGAVGGTR